MSIWGAVTTVISRVVRTFASWRFALVSASALGVLACVTTTLALSAASAWACPNEALRQESNVNPATGQPYSAGLPDCRAYEMVSPLYKQSFQAQTTPVGIPAAPDGETVGFKSEGDFGEPENYTAGSFSPEMKYTSRRGASGWITRSTYAPQNLVDLPAIFTGLNSDFPPDLRSSQVSCGMTPLGKTTTRGFTGVSCAVRTGGGPWTSSGIYPTIKDLQSSAGSGMYLGASADASHVFVQPLQRLMEDDRVDQCCSRGIYEVPVPGSESQQLRLVNVDNKEPGKDLVVLSHSGRLIVGPFIGDEREVEPPVLGTAYHAISESGETVFFTADATMPEGNETLTVYARRACASGPACVQGRETVAVSNPSLNVTDPALNISGSGAQWACVKCLPESTPQSATFQGASADGSKVFFTTKQQLLNKDTTPNLYEYDFNKPPGEKLVLLSGAPEPETKPANVKGVLRTSSDGSIVYFVATGILEATPNKTVNAEGEVENEKPRLNANNLYAHDTDSGETKFVAALEVASKGFGGVTESIDAMVPGGEGSRHAQTTPDGRYLAFSNKGGLAGNTNGKTAPGAYRYDFETGELTWISHAAPACAGGGCGKGEQSAWVAALPGTTIGAEADIEDWNRAISGCPIGVSESEKQQCPKGRYDGEYIIFTTAEGLQINDVNKATDVYEWHCSSPCPNPAGEGVVSMISDGRNAAGAEPSRGGGENPVAAMSSSGSDVFIFSATPLVGQDRDGLFDVYDARVNGGFPKPEEPISCSGEACQGTSSKPSSFGLAASSVLGAGGNLPPPLGGAFGFKVTKKLTRAQQLAKALKACKGKPKKKRAACESLARRKYGKVKAKPKKAQGRGK